MSNDFPSIHHRTKKSRRAWPPLVVIPILAVLSTSSCIPGLGSAGAAQTATTVDGASPPPSNTEASSTMKLEMLEYEFVGPSPAGVRDVIGVVANRSGYSIADVEFDLKVLNSEGEVVAIKRGVSGPAFMADGETAAFRASVERSAEDSELLIEEMRARRAVFKAAELHVELGLEYIDHEGRRSVQGEIQNPREFAVQIGEISALARDPSGDLTDVGSLIAGPTSLDADETQPFVISFEHARTEHEFEIKTHSVRIDSISETEVIWLQEPALLFDSQGNPVITGELMNPSERGHLATVLFVLAKNGEVIGLNEMVAPLALPPAGRLAIGVDHFVGPPNLREMLEQDAANLTLSATVYSSPDNSDSPPPVLLRFSLTGSERIGSGWFISGAIADEELDVFDSAVIVASLRNDLGQIATAGWVTVKLNPAEAEAEFILRLPLPENIDLSHIEPDIRVFGLR